MQSRLGIVIVALPIIALLTLLSADCARESSSTKHLDAQVQTYLKDPDAAVRQHIARQGNAGIEAVIRALGRTTKNSDVVALCDLFGGVKGGPPPDSLLKLSNAASASHRSNAMIVLGLFDDEGAMRALLTGLEDSDAEVRKHAAISIRKWVKDAGVQSRLEASLNDGSEWVRLVSAIALAEIKSELARPILVKAAASEAADARFAAAEGLSHYKDEEAARLLKELAEDKDPDVRAVARFMLHQHSSDGVTR